MKAVMLAGGEGTRLRPISAECPKPMVRLFDKPVMEYGVELLKKHGFDDISVTLQAMPQTIIDHFGDGSALGVTMRYHIEKEPLGTAGGVRAALDESDGETVLVLSGDAVTDFDLRAALDYHNQKHADATLILARRPDVLEYGLVMTGEDGRVTRFIEKPSWGQVFTDTVNTGIYILSPAALRLIPGNAPFDFARGLFPLMLERGMGLFGYPAEGYWCDIGDSGAFLRCCRDILDGRAQLDLPAQTPPPEGVSVTQPCYIGRGVRFGSGVSIGPYAVIGAGSIVDDGARVEGGVLDGAVMEARSRCTGAYLGRGAVLRENASVLEGAVIGGGASVGEGALVLEGARVWPRKEIQPGARVSGNVSKGAAPRGSVFDANGVIRGLPHVDVTPDFCFKLGLAAAQPAREDVAVSWRGGEAARVAALALEAGVCSGGGRAVLTDALTPSCAAFAGKAHRIPLNIFVRQDGRLLTLYLFDQDGVAPGRAEERRLEASVLRGDITPADPQSLRPARYLSGLAEQYAAEAAAPPRWAVSGFAPVPMSAGGSGPETDLLRRALALAGCVPNGGPILYSDGLSLTAVLEDGREADPAHLLGSMIFMEAACGADRLALPCDAPAFLDDVAARQGVRALRVERDGEKARALLAAQPYMRDPVFMAARLAHGCRKHKKGLSGFLGQLPSFHLTAGEVAVRADRGAVMRELARLFPGAELSEGIRSRARGGWVRVAPLPNRSALRIIAEGMSAELADELYADFARKVESLGNGSEK
ncbi:MAG: NTP transferase domain-containing protein [Oscillospiraceae bacterium]|nr:NTP transferase domain-containing protein [Oscillospiraceae bacterium]